MKRCLHFLPAVLAGLAMGFLFLAALKQRPPAPGNPRTPPVVETPDGHPDIPAPDPLESLVQTRFPLPVVPPGPADAQLRLMELSEPGRSPARAALTLEVYENLLPVDGVPDSLFLNSAASGRGEEAVARLAREKPFKALLNVNAEAGWNKLPPDRAHALRRRVFHEWLLRDPAAALTAVMGRSPDIPSDPETVSVRERGQNLQAFVEAWAVLDPAAAGAALGSLPESGPGAGRADLAAILFRQWYQRDPVAACQWSAHQEPELGKAMASLAEELGARDPAARTAVLLAASERDSSRLVPVFAGWLEADQTAALAKMAAIAPEDGFWEHQASSVVQQWATTLSLNANVEAAAAEALASMPAGPPREAFLKGLVEFGASNRIPFAVRMADEMAEGRPRIEAMGSLTELWMRKDPAALSEWLRQQPMAESRHAAVSRFATLLAPLDPEAAACWADSIPDGYWQKDSVLQAVRQQPGQAPPESGR